MNVTHTHRGHCQRCARVQAIDVATGLLALHGYDVKDGYFSGTCEGSNHLSLHVDRELTDQYIAAARADERRCLNLAARLRNDTDHPAKVWNGAYHKAPDPTRHNPKRMRDVRTMISWESASKAQQDRQVLEEVHALQRKAERAREYADDTQRWADRICGKVDAYPVADLEPKAWSVGDTLRVGGKTGYSAVIEAIEDRSYRTNGFSRGSHTIMTPHALITRPAVTEKRVGKGGNEYITRQAKPARQIWEPLRNYKRPVTPLAEMLKKAGKL